MKVLFIGGTGIISSASVRLAAQRGIDLTVLTRGQRTSEMPAGVKTLTVDIRSASAVQALQNLQFDVVVEWVGFTPDDVERDIELFSGRTRQYVFISSASAYQKPATHYLITESTPLANPYWEYSRNKIACEDRLMRAYRESGFPITIIRPSLTYGDTQIPLAINNWEMPYTAVDRMLKGKEVIVPGDGSSLWVITHNSDFAKGLVGLLGHQQAVGHAFHITTDEVMTWDQFYRTTGEAAGVEPRLIHIASDFLTACRPGMLGSLTGDKSVSTVFDNSKIKRFVPNYCATTSFAQGIRQTLSWFNADPTRKRIDHEMDAGWDKLIAAYKSGLKVAVEDK